MSESCKSCRFFRPATETLYPAVCRRSPHFRERDEDDWCGEYEAKPVEKPEPVQSFHERVAEQLLKEQERTLVVCYNRYECSQCNFTVGAEQLPEKPFDAHNCSSYPIPTKDES